MLIAYLLKTYGLINLKYKLAIMKATCTVIALIFTIACWAQDPQNNGGKIQGNVKEICYYSMGMKDSVVELRTLSFVPSEYYIDSFSKVGDKLCSYWIRKGVVTRKEEIKSDDTATYTSVNGNLVEQTLLKPRVKNNLQKEQLSDGKYKKLIYDTAGRIILESYFDCNDIFIHSIKHIYTSAQLEVTEDSTEGGTVFKHVHKYNEKRQVVASESEFIHTDCSGRSVYEYAYDDKGNKTSETHNGGLYWKYIWEYDDHNNVVLEKHYDGDGNLTYSFSTEYIYDSHGNWIRRVKNGLKAYMVMIRDIEYY